MNFYEALEFKVNKYFRETGYQKTGGFLLHVRAFGWLALYTVTLFAIFFADLPNWLFWVTWLIHACTHILIPVTWVHEGIHGSFSSIPFMAQLAPKMFGLAGGNSYIFEKTHLAVHSKHSKQDKRNTVEDQRFLMDVNEKNPPTIFYLFFSFYLLFFREPRIISNSKDFPVQQLLFILFTKLTYIFVFLVLPYLIIDKEWWVILTGQAIMYLFMSIVYVILLLMPTEEIIQPGENPSDEILNKWAIEVLKHNVDFSPQSKLLNWIVSGSNMNVIHHMYPEISHVHYNAISAIVKETAKEYDLIYREHNFVEVFSKPFKYFKLLKEEEKQRMS